MKRSRGWILTLWSEKIEKIDTVVSRLEDDKKLLYAIGGNEVCPDSGRPHIQAFVYYENAITGNGLHKRLGLEHGTYHGEAQRGLNQQASDYCKKDGDIVFKIGVIPEEGKVATSAWDYILGMIEDGATNAEIMRRYPSHFARCKSGIDAMRMELSAEKLNSWREVEVCYLWGKSGSGKTRGVIEMTTNPADIYRVTDYKHPFDNYRGQSVILFEEFRSSLKIEQMLNYLDGYYCELPSRYSNKMALWTKVFFCTNIPLDHQFTSVQMNHPETWNAFLRRIDQTLEVN